MEIQKVITDNPLIDELVYYSKLLASETLLKLEDKAIENETLESLKASDIMIACEEGKASLYLFDYTKEDLASVGISTSDPNLQTYLTKSDKIPSPYRERLLSNLVEKFKNNYEEQNNYYRTLYGMPDYIAKYVPTKYHMEVSPTINISKPLHKFTLKDIEYLESLGLLNPILLETNSVLKTWKEKNGTVFTTVKRICYKEWLYIPEDFKEEVSGYKINAELPIHQYGISEIAALEQIGLIDYFKEEYPDKEYINFLGIKKVTPYVARKTLRFAPLYIPSIGITEVYNKYYERLLINRDFVIKTIYSEAYKIKSNKYENFIAAYIIVLTFCDMLIGAPDYLIKKELFDIRTIQYLFESYGVKFFSDIPLKYQQKIVKLLNLFLKYKSSPKCMKDICSIFDMKDIFIYRYFLIKDRMINKDYSFYFSDPTNIRLFHESGIEGNLSKLYQIVDNKSTGHDRIWKAFNNDDSLLATIKYSEELECWILTDSDENIVATLKNEDPRKPDDPVGNWIVNSNDFSQTVYSRFIDTNIDDFELRFCKVLLDENIEDALRDTTNYRDYDSVMSNDPYWDGDRTHDEVMEEILKRKFNFLRSKYLSLDILYDLSELSVQRPYFFSLIFDEEERVDKLSISVEKISGTRKFKFNDLVCYLLSLTFIHQGIRDDIFHDKTRILHVIGFNFDADITYLQNYLLDKEITDLDLSKFIPNSSYATYDILLEYYTRNVDLREELVNRMNEADNKRIYDIYKKIYDATMVQELNNNLFKDKNGNVYETYGDYVRSRDPVLGDSLDQISNILDVDQKNAVISDIMLSAIEAIEYETKDNEAIKYAFSNFGSVSYEAVTTYIRHLIDFFKSFTVQIAEMNSIYQISTPFDNKLSPIDDFHSLISHWTRSTTVEVRDTLNDLTSTHNINDKVSLIDRLYIDITHDN